MEEPLPWSYTDTSILMIMAAGVLLVGWFVSRYQEQRDNQKESLLTFFIGRMVWFSLFLAVCLFILDGIE
jgi:hypothetical protein